MKMTELFFALSALVAAGYVLLQAWLLLQWRKGKPAPVVAEPSTSIVVIVPARNEAANIRACIESLLAQEYPRTLLRIFIVDDHSEDETANLVKLFAQRHANLHLLRLPLNLRGKKQAISFAIEASQTSTRDLIVTTDADCRHAPRWLHTLAACHETENPALISAPVKMEAGTGFLKNFQALEWCGLQLAGGAALIGNRALYCSGANLAYPREMFEAVNGYTGDNHASGDDVLLMLRIAELKRGKIRFLKDQNAIVTTAPVDSWRQLLQQRRRWTSKFSRYRSAFLLQSSVLVFLVNLLLLVAAVMAFSGFANAFFVLLIAKAGIDFLLLTLATAFFRQEKQLFFFFPAMLIYFMYAVAATAGGLAGVFEWKGRSYRKGAA